ncbi:hypothetical protein [Streptomyces sp. NPDC021356]|uniref:hypothetical protein n=1 Tax=Streptomyces sp. NPDC021356 TaxID=3154900 RepID=UPI0033DB74AF
MCSILVGFDRSAVVTVRSRTPTVLSRWLDVNREDPELALAEFRNVRIPRAHAVQRQSLLNSKLVHAGD